LKSCEKTIENCIPLLPQDESKINPPIVMISRPLANPLNK